MHSGRLHDRYIDMFFNIHMKSILMYETELIPWQGSNIGSLNFMTLILRFMTLGEKNYCELLLVLGDLGCNNSGLFVM